MEELSLESMMSDLSVSENKTEEQIKQEEVVKSEVEEMSNTKENVVAEYIVEGLKKSMSELETDFIKIKRSEEDINKKIEKIKKDNEAVFKQIEELEAEKVKVLEPEKNLKEVIAKKMSTEVPDKKWKGMEVSFTYFPPTERKDFSKEICKSKYPKEYEECLVVSPVSEYIKATVKLSEKLTPEVSVEESKGE